MAVVVKRSPVLVSVLVSCTILAVLLLFVFVSGTTWNGRTARRLRKTRWKGMSHTLSQKYNRLCYLVYVVLQQCNCLKSQVCTVWSWFVGRRWRLWASWCSWKTGNLPINYNELEISIAWCLMRVQLESTSTHRKFEVIIILSQFHNVHQ